MYVFMHTTRNSTLVYTFRYVYNIVFESAPASRSKNVSCELVCGWIKGR